LLGKKGYVVVVVVLRYADHFAGSHWYV